MWCKAGRRRKTGTSARNTSLGGWQAQNKYIYTSTYRLAFLYSTNIPHLNHLLQLSLCCVILCSLFAHCYQGRRFLNKPSYIYNHLVWARGSQIITLPYRILVPISNTVKLRV